MRTDAVYYRETTGAVTGAIISGFTMDYDQVIVMCLSFLTPTILIYYNIL